MEKADYEIDYEYGTKMELEFFKRWNENHQDNQIKHIAQKNTPDFLTKKEKYLELKSDKHKTGNFFIELISNCSKNTIGGPRQAKGHGSDFYIIWFPELGGLVYIFEINKLIDWLDKNENKYKKVKKENKGYWTEGILVERTILKDLYRHTVLS